MVAGPSVEDYKREGLQRIHALIVGGGATGQVYGHFLAEAGAEVAYYLKPRYAAEAEEGFDLHPYGLIGRRPHRHFGGFEVYTRPQEVRGTRIDQVWLCVSAPAMRSGIVQTLADSCPDALWVCTQPGLDAREYMLETVPSDRLVMGMTGYVAYQAPLPGEEISPPGCAYYLPPLSPSLFSGRHAEVVANLLQRGGMPAGARPDVENLARFASGILIPFVLSLETMGWSLDALKRDDRALKVLCGSITEVFASLEKETGTRQGMKANFQQRWLWKLVLSLAEKLTPFDLQTYFEYHFTKVRRQSEDMIHEFKLLCDRQGFESTNLERLEDAWYARRTAVHESAQVATVAGRSEADTAPQPILRHDDDDATPTPIPAPGLLPVPTEDTQPVPLTALEGDDPTGETGAEPSEADTREHARLDADLLEPAAADDAATTMRSRAALLGVEAESSDGLSGLLAEASRAADGDTNPDRPKLADTKPTVPSSPLDTVPARPVRPSLPSMPGTARKASADEPTQPVAVLKDPPELTIEPTNPAPTKPMKRFDEPPAKVGFGDQEGGLGKEDFIQTEFAQDALKFDPTDVGGTFGVDED